MTKRKENMFDTAAAMREKEQAELTAAATGQETPKRSTALGKITLSMSEEDKIKVKKYAIDHGITVSDLIHTWISQYC